MRIALAQMDVAWESAEYNRKHALSFIKQAADLHSDVIVFPEMFTTGFTMNLKAITENENETSHFLSKNSLEHSINIIAGFALPASPEVSTASMTTDSLRISGIRGKNVAQVYNRKGTLVATYTKIHPFPLLREQDYFEVGSAPCIFELEGMPSSVFICYDLRFPETFRSVASRTIVTYVIANWPSSREDHWTSLLKARAIENQCFIIGVNRTGTDGNGIHYSGSSLVFGPSGNVVCSAEKGETLLTADIKPEEASQVRKEFPFLDYASGAG